MRKSVYHVRLKDIDGNEIVLGKFKGKKILVVNVASECMYTAQYAELQDLYSHYKDKLMIIGCPCNDFGNQEPGTPATIKRFCHREFNIEFLMAEKMNIAKDPHPLYAFLTSEIFNGKANYEVTWNFHKFLLDENGYLLESFPSSIHPLDERLLNQL